MKEIMPTRARKCRAEYQFQVWGQEKGFISIGRGWPDFFCLDEFTGEIMLVKVKKNREKELSRYERLILEKLAAYGVPCYRWDAESRKLQPIK